MERQRFEAAIARLSPEMKPKVIRGIADEIATSVPESDNVTNVFFGEPVDSLSNLRTTKLAWIVLTDARLICTKKATLKKPVLLDIPWSSIRETEVVPDTFGTGSSWLKLSGTFGLRHFHMHQTTAHQMLAAIDDAIAMTTSPIKVEVVREEGVAVADQLGRLAELHAHGHLSDAEFATAKAKLLS